MSSSFKTMLESTLKSSEWNLTYTNGAGDLWINFLLAVFMPLFYIHLWNNGTVENKTVNCVVPLKKQVI